VSAPLLEVDGLEKSYSGITALDGATFSVEAGELVGLIGPNGAGKTTLFDCVSGVQPPSAGRVRLDGTDVTGEAPHTLARDRGLVRTFQQTREFATMTVRENVLLPALDHPGERIYGAVGRTDAAAEREAAVEERAAELLEFFDLAHLADEYAGTLSGGQRKLLEVARALMLDPDLFMLDEPLAGVNPTLAASIVEYVQELNDEGMTFLVIEHEIETLVDLVDRIVVMNRGSVLADGDPQAVVRDEAVVEADLGGDVEA